MNANPEAAAPRRTRLRFALNALVSLGVLALIASGTDAASVASSMARLPAEALALSFAIAVGQTLLANWRWLLVLRGVGIAPPPWPALQATFVGLLFSQALPTYVGGDAYRSLWLYREGHPAAPAIRGVLIDRVSAVVALVLLLAAGLPGLAARVGDAATLAGPLAALALGIAGVVAVLCGDFLFPGRQHWRPLRELAELARAARAVLLARRGVPIVAVSVLVHVASVALVIVLARALHLQLAVADAFALVPAVMLLASVPISIGGWGVREAVMIAGLGLVGVGAEQAVALSLTLGFVLLADALLGVLPLVAAHRRFMAFGPRSG